MIEGIAKRLLQRVKASQPPDGYYREQLMGKLKRLAEIDPLPPDVALRGLCGRLADLVNIRERLTRRPVTERRVNELKGYLE